LFEVTTRGGRSQYDIKEPLGKTLESYCHGRLKKNVKKIVLKRETSALWNKQVTALPFFLRIKNPLND